MASFDVASDCSPNTSAAWSPISTGISSSVDSQDLELPSLAPPAVELPDLVEHLKKAGTYEQYLRWRQGYMNWRSGAPSGAHGELSGGGGCKLTAQEIKSGAWRKRPEFMYPSQQVFLFHRTASYWVATTYVEGCLLFSIAGVCSFFTGVGGKLAHLHNSLVTYPCLVGSCMFTIGGYFGFFQLINLPNKDSRNRVITFWSWRLQHLLQYTDLPSVIGKVAYFAGAILFNICAVVDIIVPDVWVLPYARVAAGFGYAVAAVVQGIQNDVHLRPRLCDSSWWVCVTYGIAGPCVFMGKILALYPDVYQTVKILSVMSAFSYTVGSILLFSLWREQQFGLFYVKILNRTPRFDQPGSISKFSCCGIIFQFIYSSVSTMAICHICLLSHLCCSYDVLSLKVLSDMALQAIIVLLTHAVLMVNASLTKLPSLQPARCIMTVFRVSWILASLVSTFKFAVSLYSLAPDASGGLAEPSVLVG